MHANITDRTPRRLPDSWDDGSALHMGLPAMSAAQLAALGWYPVRYEPLEPGAAGHGEMFFEDELAEFIVPSLPGDLGRALAEAKSAKYQERLDALISARGTGFTHAGRLVDSDPESRSLISGAVQLATLALMAGTAEALAQFAAVLGAGRRYSDGSIAATDAHGMIALGQSLAIRVAMCDAVSQFHKAAIGACTTVSEVNALDVTGGCDI